MRNNHVLGRYHGPDPTPVQPEELRAAYQRIARLEADLTECLEYFQDHYDVVDGDYGEPAPNKEMRLGTMLEETLGLEPFPTGVSA